MGLGKISVGPPYFDAIFFPLMAPAMFLMGIGPVLRWKNAKTLELATKLKWAFAISLVSAIIVPMVMGSWSVFVSIGLLLGSMLAMWLARVFGRPLAERLVGKGRLDKWEATTHSDSIFLWFILILSPTGDLPYFLAGLSRTRFSTIFLLVLAIRVPTTFVVASAGAGVLLLAWWQLAMIGVALTVLLLIFMRYQEPMTRWVDAQVLGKMSQKATANDTEGAEV